MEDKTDKITKKHTAMAEIIISLIIFVKIIATFNDNFVVENTSNMVLLYVFFHNTLDIMEITNV